MSGGDGLEIIEFFMKLKKTKGYFVFFELNAEHQKPTKNKRASYL